TLDLDFASRRVSLPASQQLNPIAIEVAGIPARDPQIVVNSGLTAYRDTGRVQVAGRGNLAFGDAGGDIVSAFYAIQAMGTDTPPSSGTIETPGPIVVIHPAREAPSLGSLPVLPVTPDEPVVLSWDSEEHAIETLNLHRITIPRFLKHGRAVRFAFGGLTYAQAETLAAFLATNSGAFRHQWKGWTEVAWRAIPDTWQMRGGDGVLLSASFEAIELRFVGP
ncbi:MAG TPA: hypothetical protein VFP48_00690, partial [Steroidobacteraceae bacterium]|nr:hypothetical protein [Steroidobacteraceae bacterium]